MFFTIYEFKKGFKNPFLYYFSFFVNVAKIHILFKDKIEDKIMTKKRFMYLQ